LGETRTKVGTPRAQDAEPGEETRNFDKRDIEIKTELSYPKAET
jgi:hypothetical protein